MKNNFHLKKALMNLTCFVLIMTLLSSLAFASDIHGQGIKSSDIVFTKKIKDLDQVINEIEEQTEYRFFYEDQAISEDNYKIKMDISAGTVFEILTEVSNQTGLAFRQINNTIAIRTELEVDGAIPDVISVQPQIKTIRGKVTDSSGLPLPGASIIIKGTTVGVTSDVNGNYSFEVPGDAKVLVFSFIGMQTQEIAIENQTKINVSFKEASVGLEEVVAVGYGVQKKVNLTGAVDQIGSKELEALQVNTIAEALQGQIPNLNIDIADGKPGRAASFNIRGTTSINGGEPLIIIDEVASTATDLNNLSPKDIEAISVLKDASSAAIYGARGAYGVILVTTKHAKDKKFQLNYSNNFGWSKPTRVVELYDAPDYASIVNQFASNIGSLYYTSSQINYFEDSWNDSSLPDAKYQSLGGSLFGSHQHNYFKEWFRDYTPKQNHHISLIGGDEKLKYFLSCDYNHEEGSFKYNPDKIDRYSLRSNISYDINKHIRIYNNSSFLKRDDDMAYAYVYSWISNIQRYLEMINPYFPETVDVNGTETFTDAGFFKDFVSNKSADKTAYNQFSTTVGTDLSFLNNDLKVHGNFSYKHYDTNNIVWADLNTPMLYLYSNNNVVSNSFPSGTSRIQRILANFTTTYINAYATYDKSLAQKHYISLMAGFNREDNSYLSMKGYRASPYAVSQHSLNLADGSATITESDDNNANQSAFFRANYNYKQRYLFELNSSYNVSSKFANGNRNAMFYSFSGGWRVSEESFFESLKNSIDNLKIRASYGSLGNQNIGSYDYLSILTMQQQNYTLEGERVNYTTSPDPKSDNFTWETAKTIDLGLDIALMNSRLSFSGDIYQRDTKNMLATFHSLPSVFGATVPKENNAKLRTTGWEVSLYWKDNFNLANKTFSYGVRFNISDYSSEIRDYYNETNYLGDYYVGQKIGEIWGLQTDGYFLTDEEAQNGPLLNTNRNRNYAQAGYIKFKDVNKDKVISKGAWTLDDHGDFSVIGNTTPRYQYSFALNASWNGFDINALFKGVGKRDIYPDMGSSVFWGPYARKYVIMPKFVGENVWSLEHPDAYFPLPQAYIAGDENLDLSTPQTKYLQNAAYLRLKNLTIGYTLPEKLVSKIKAEKLRLYFTGTNLFEFSKLNKALDPEGLDHDPDAYDNYVGMGTTYSVPRSYSLGLEVQF